MNTISIVVADAKYARFFSVEPAAGQRGRPRLVERSTLFNPAVEGARRGGAGSVKSERVSNRQAGAVHPIEARRQQHRLELERRFGREISRRISETTDSWKTGTVVLIADPRLLGLMRETVRDALKADIALKELAKDYVGLTPDELHDRLARNRLVPARGRATAAPDGSVAPG